MSGKKTNHVMEKEVDRDLNKDTNKSTGHAQTSRRTKVERK
jgi:hypothetical protein